MTRTALLTILLAGLILATGTTPASGQDKNKAEELEKKYEDLKRQYDDLKRQSDSIVEDLKKIKAADIDFRLARLEEQSKSIRDMLGRIEQAITSKPGQERVAKSIDPGSGTIVLVNDSNFNADVILNGRTYRVNANDRRRVPNFPAGDFTYEVLADGFGALKPMQLRTLAANNTFTVFIYPR